MGGSVASTTQVSVLQQNMLGSLRGYWGQAEGYQKFLYFVGFLLLASAVFHAGVVIVTGGSLEGDVSWRKPILFGESFGLTALSVAWIMSYLPKWRVSGWLLAGTLGIANFGEVFLVAMQQWRGVPSHFNHSTPFDDGVFVLMGILIMFTGTVILVVTLLTFFALKAPPSIAWASRIGMVLLVSGQILGIPMIRLESHTFGAVGAMKVPHALALHGAQVLPVLAWLLLFTNWSETRRSVSVLVAAAGYCALVAVSAFQSFRGVAPLDLSLPAAVLFGISGAALLASYAAALRNVFAARP